MSHIYILPRYPTSKIDAYSAVKTAVPGVFYRSQFSANNLENSMSELLDRTVNRRQILASAAAGTVAISFGGKANASSGQIVVANWGGDWNDRTVQFFEAPIVEKAGYTVVRDLGLLDQRRTKLLASRRLPRGTIDVAHLDDASAFEMEAQGVLETVSADKIPNLKNVLPQLKSATFVPWQYSGWVIGHNPDKLKDAPKSFADLWNPKYSGMIGLSDTHWYHHIEVAALKVGKSLENIDVEKVKAAMMDMKKATKPRIYPGHLQQEQGLKNEEILIGTNYKSRLLQFAAEGVRVVPTYPTEGAISIIFGLGIPKKAPNPEGANFYCNALLDPAGLASLVQKSFYSPANSKTVLPEAAQKEIAFSPDEQKALHKRPHAWWLKNRSELLDFYNKEFKG
jgi:putative spermidine/putrescine transport system substrate-binding protein